MDDDIYVFFRRKQIQAKAKLRESRFVTLRWFKNCMFLWLNLGPKIFPQVCAAQDCQGGGASEMFLKVRLLMNVVCLFFWHLLERHIFQIPWSVCIFWGIQHTQSALLYVLFCKLYTPIKIVTNCNSREHQLNYIRFSQNDIPDPNFLLHS